MLRAISSGVTAPIWRPMGACTCSSQSAGAPSDASASKIYATLARLPIMPT